MTNALAIRLPDFRNLGVIIRLIVLVEGGAFLVVLLNEPSVARAITIFAQSGVLREPLLLFVIGWLALLSPVLAKISYWRGVALILFLVFLSGELAANIYMEAIQADLIIPGWRIGLTALLIAGIALAYFNWRYRVLSPALSEARLMALQARIRPHFLFNSLNTVLGLIRVEPVRAEIVLENLAELYRALLTEVGTLVPLAKEVELARSYAEIEAMRLGERLKVDWQCQQEAMDSLVPPLLLQPLLENAVYHGVEPSEIGGEVIVKAYIKEGRLILEMHNPCASPSQRLRGNRMALENIRERLDLHFDAEAEMGTYRAGDEFVVQIRMPYKHA